ncbi:MAG: sodium:solute symporter family protein [Cytophagales bacterium]|nr:sodium:solute symporter family protein [Cytophagales bacterium]MCA6369229.1 sodium:solute symporter family protein [Cytophagales bacterium]MCA6372392.1 sodium:solute symporter family protein [Cytophagales bacterium]MCA6374769.1 sodium:solute symporter family protein [Cytophagales bacterium]MCA6382217.1 sodium:solute symporter family protein [Cytophagales bacterium]
MLLASIIAYLLLTILIGYWASRKVKTSGDFMLAGRSLPIFLSASALFATWFGSETVFGASSEFLKGGLYSVIEDPFGAALCLLLFGLFFARKLYNMNLLTLGDFFKVRFGNRTELVASFFLAPPYVGYIAAQLVAMGLIINVVTGLEVWQGVVISAFVVTFYTYIGGMWAISITDFFQSIVIVVGLLALAIILANKAGGVTVILQEVHPSTFRFLPEWSFKEIMLYLAAWSVLGLGSLPSQDIFQRVMSSGSQKIAVRSCFIAAGLYLTVAMLPLFIGLCAKHLYPQTTSVDAQLALPNMVLAHASLPIQILFFGSLLSAIMSTTSSAILAPAAIFSENLIKPLSKGKLKDKQLLIITRLCVLGFAGVATVMACLRSNIYELVGESSILSLVSLLAPMVLGLYWKKANANGALLAMVLGTLTLAYFSFYDVGWPALLPATLVSFLAMIGGSLFLKTKEFV